MSGNPNLAAILPDKKCTRFYFNKKKKKKLAQLKNSPTKIFSPVSKLLSLNKQLQTTAFHLHLHFSFSNQN